MEGITYSESDVALRLVEVWYDITWAYYMSSSGNNVAKRIDDRRKVVTKAAAGDGMLGKSIKEKLQGLQRSLQNIKLLMKARQFEDICRVSLKSSDDLYPGFKDVLLIVQHLMKGSDRYAGLLTPEELNGLTLTLVFQCIYYRVCAFLLAHRMGREACKLVITPAKISHATYDICRQKFSQLLCDQTHVVHDGLLDAIKRIHMDREGGLEEQTDGDGVTSTASPVVTEDENAPPDAAVWEPQTVPSPAPTTGNAPVSVPRPPPPGIDDPDDPDSDVDAVVPDIPKPSLKRGAMPSTASIASAVKTVSAPASNVRRPLTRAESIRFPMIDLSTDEDDSSVSSNESDL